VNTTVRAGFGSKTITPPPDTELSGYGFYPERRISRVLDPLVARCLLLDDGRTRLAIVSCDLIGFTIGYADDVRRRIAAALGTSVEHVMLACTHTHSGPNTCELLAMGAVNDEYMARLPAMIFEACEAAVTDLAPTEIGWTIGDVETIGYCRRDEVPADYEDPCLGVLVCRREKGNIGFVQYACHAVTLGVNTECSADYPGAVARVMREHGIETLFLNGPSGDIDPRVNQVKWASGTPDDVERYGRRLGDRAAALTERLEWSGAGQLRAHEKRLVLPVRVPEEATLAAAHAQATEQFAQTGTPQDRFEMEAAARLLAKLRAETGVTTTDFVVQMLQIDELRLVGLSGEIYSVVGRAAVRAVGAPALGVAHANGALGYVPDQAALAAYTDYGSHGSTKFYGHFLLDPTTPELIVQAVRRLAHAA